MNFLSKTMDSKKNNEKVPSLLPNKHTSNAHGSSDTDRFLQPREPIKATADILEEIYYELSNSSINPGLFGIKQFFLYCLSVHCMCYPALIVVFIGK